MRSYLTPCIEDEDGGGLKLFANRKGSQSREAKNVRPVVKRRQGAKRQNVPPYLRKNADNSDRIKVINRYALAHGCSVTVRVQMIQRRMKLTDHAVVFRLARLNMIQDGLLSALNCNYTYKKNCMLGCNLTVSYHLKLYFSLAQISYSQEALSVR